MHFWCVVTENTYFIAGLLNKKVHKGKAWKRVPSVARLSDGNRINIDID